MSPARLSPKSILCGPILRRSEPSRVCVWLATDVDVTVRGEIIPARLARTAAPVSRQDLLGEGESRSLRLGEKLYVTLVEIRPLERGGARKTAIPLFPTDQLLAYDLAIRPTDLLNPKDTRSERRLAFFFPAGRPITHPESGIAYAGVRLPTFYLPSRQKGRPNLLYGSCRKLSGEGGDALGFADQILRRNAAIPDDAGTSAGLSNRPSALFLMGDQIYADDVAEPLLYHLQGLAREIIGHSEQVPTRNGTLHPRSPGSYGVWREPLSRLLTSDGNGRWLHLVSFGEFVAMYLLAWHPAHWPETWKVPPGRSLNEETAGILNASRAEVPGIRRALANVPTYMIFDDHEVSDDWNLNEAWQVRVQQQSELGRRLVTNSLAAYWAFQAWGNDPDSFDELKKIVPQELAGVDDRRGKAFEEALLGRRWSFTAPTWPEALFLDTRTHRDLASAGDGAPGRPATRPPRLLDSEGLRKLERDIEVQSLDRDGILLVVAPSPIFNVRLTEKLLAVVGQRIGDLELWIDNPGGYIDVVRALARSTAKMCVILSGDVHYMFAQRATLLEDGKPASPPFLQLTSSAIQNLHTEANETIVDLIRNNSVVERFLGLDPRIPRIRDLSDLSAKGLCVRLEVLPGASVGALGGVRPTFERTIFKESNLGQLEVVSGEVRATFWSRSLQERRKPRTQPSPDSPVVRCRV